MASPVAVPVALASAGETSWRVSVTRRMRRPLGRCRLLVADGGEILNFPDVVELGRPRLISSEWVGGRVR